VIVGQPVYNVINVSYYDTKYSMVEIFNYFFHINLRPPSVSVDIMQTHTHINTHIKKTDKKANFKIDKCAICVMQCYVQANGIKIS